MAHLMPCIPKSELQVASGVSSCASAGAATTVSSGLSETSDGLSWSKMINKSWTGTASSIHLESIKCFVRFIGWWCYKIRTPENQKSWNIYLKKLPTKYSNIFKQFHPMPSIPKSKPQETSGGSIGASAGSSAGLFCFFVASEGRNDYELLYGKSSGLSETSDGSGWSKMIKEYQRWSKYIIAGHSWTRTDSSINPKKHQVFCRVHRLVLL